MSAAMSTSAARRLWMLARTLSPKATRRARMAIPSRFCHLCILFEHLHQLIIDLLRDLTFQRTRQALFLLRKFDRLLAALEISASAVHASALVDLYFHLRCAHDADQLLLWQLFLCRYTLAHRYLSHTITSSVVILIVFIEIDVIVDPVVLTFFLFLTLDFRKLL